MSKQKKHSKLKQNKYNGIEKDHINAKKHITAKGVNQLKHNILPSSCSLRAPGADSELPLQQTKHTYMLHAIDSIYCI